MIGLSLTFTSIKQKIQFSQHFELIPIFYEVFRSFLCVLITNESHAAEKSISTKKTDPCKGKEQISKSEE